MAREPGVALEGSSSTSGGGDRRSLKLLMRQWEREWSEANGGLVPTHEDKKHDNKYTQLKSQSKLIDTKGKGSQSGLLLDNGRPSAMEMYSGGGAVRGSKITGSHLQLYGTMGSGVAVDSADGSFVFEGGHISLSAFHYVLLILMCGIPYAMFISCFSLFGFGALIFDYLVSNASLFYPLNYSACALAMGLYVFDASYWKHPLAVVLRRLLVAVAAFVLVFGGLVATEEYPYAPMLLLFCGAPMYWWLVKVRCLQSWPITDYLRALFLALCLLSLGTAALWVSWVASGNNWNLANKRRWMLQMRCCTELGELAQMLINGGYPDAASMLGAPDHLVLSYLNLTASVSTSSVWDGLRWPTSSNNVSLLGDPPLANGGYYRGSGVGLLEGAGVDETDCLVLPSQPCLSVLLFWSAPFTSAGAGMMAALLSSVLRRQLRAEQLSQSGVSAGARFFIVGVSLAAAALWISASISGAGMGVSRVVLLGMIVLVGVLSVLLDRLFGWQNMVRAIATKEPLARRMIRFFLTSDWSKAASIAVAAPLIGLAFGLSVVNQLVRVHVRHSVVLPNERATWTTPLVARHLQRLRAWNWSSVLRKVIVLSVFYLSCTVGVMKLTTFFMSWLVMQVSDMGLPMATAIFVTVGMTMFLLPPVPGAPVYMASGVLVTSAARDTLGYLPAILYAIAVGFCIKLCACAMQQKGFGGNLRRSVRVRAAVGINTPLMRAINVMMSEPGFTRGKVATLVGGPDWPTSVLMGILGQRLAPMVLGTTPVIFLVSPLTLAGAFMIQGPNEPYPALTNIALAMSSITQVGAGLAMLHYVERATHTMREQLEKLPYDLEVLALDQAEAEYAALYVELTSWQCAIVPWWARAVLVVGAVLGDLACLFATLFDSRCFLPFALYPDFATQVETNLHGDASNLVQPGGYMVLMAGVLSFGCRWLFQKWASRVVGEHYKQGRRAAAATRGRAATRGPPAKEVEASPGTNFSPGGRPSAFGCHVAAAAAAAAERASKHSPPPPEPDSFKPGPRPLCRTDSAALSRPTKEAPPRVSRRSRNSAASDGLLAPGSATATAAVGGGMVLGSADVAAAALVA